jgi:hypothetical protein
MSHEEQEIRARIKEIQLLFYMTTITQILLQKIGRSSVLSLLVGQAKCSQES